MELELGWTGLLVEPSPVIYPKGFLKQRKAWASPTCLSTKTRPEIVPFASRTVENGSAGIARERGEGTFDIQCLPLYSLIRAVGNVTINYLSLDIEGAELPVLQTLPWEDLDIEVMTVETNHAGEVFPGTRQELRDFLDLKGYVFITCLSGVDDVFVREDLYHGKYAPDYEAVRRLMEREERAEKMEL